MAVSRTREYAADKSGAKLSGDPIALASALQKLEAASQQIPMQTAETHPATAHIFIVNPLTGKLVSIELRAQGAKPAIEPTEISANPCMATQE